MPFLTYILFVPVIAWFGYTATHLYSVGEPMFDPKSFIAAVALRENVQNMIYAVAFGFFWLIAFISAMEHFIVAATTCMWYFSGQGSDDVSESKMGNVEISIAVKWAFMYHLGTLATGSLIIAIITVIKVVFEYFAKK